MGKLIPDRVRVIGSSLLSNTIIRETMDWAAATLKK